MYDWCWTGFGTGVGTGVPKDMGRMNWVGTGVGTGVPKDLGRMNWVGTGLVTGVSRGGLYRGIRIMSGWQVVHKAPP